MKTFLNATLILSSLLFSSFISASMESDGVEMPKTISIEDKELKLNGMGTRRATFLRIRVYVGGLYLEEKSSDYNSFIKDDTIKHIRMSFLRNVGKSDISKAWKEGFVNANGELGEYESLINDLNSRMEDLKRGDEMLFTFFPDRVEIILKDKKPHVIKNPSFSKKLLAIWFINAEDENLKKGLLGTF